MAWQVGKWLSFMGSALALSIMTVISVGIGYAFRSVPDALKSSLPVGQYLSVALMVYFGVKTLRARHHALPAAWYRLATGCSCTLPPQSVAHGGGAGGGKCLEARARFVAGLSPSSGRGCRMHGARPAKRTARAATSWRRRRRSWPTPSRAAASPRARPGNPSWRRVGWEGFRPLPW